jgi:putative addiction module component (TIGR02574 family)
MSTTVEELATQAITLSAEDRARLADLLLASLPAGEDPDVDAAWDEEIRRRVEAVELGAARLVPAEEVHAEARKIYKR